MPLQKGFTLLECTIYSFILAILSIIVFNFFIAQYQKLSAVTKTGQQRMAFYAAYDLLTRDIQSAHATVAQWNFSEDASIIFQGNQNCIGWVLDKRNLYRITGDYDFIQRIWNKKSKALVATDFDEFTYKVIQNDTIIQGLKIGLQMALLEPLAKTIPLCNRVIE